ncbi:MAG TPA: hypothetical protein VG992_04700 [Candidatus Saccharimonadales bacterium]|nr:hypothetical protein [Candidatus Saccharimonadales bacterium]
MPKLRGSRYQVNRPLATAGRTIWQTQIMLIFAPLLIVVGFCSVYIQISIHHQTALSKATHQQHQMSQDVTNLPALKLTTQSKLPTIQAKTSTPDGSSDADASHDQQAAAPEASNNNFSYLQSGYDFNNWSHQLSVGYSKNSYILNTKSSNSHSSSHSNNSQKHKK